MRSVASFLTRQIRHVDRVAKCSTSSSHVIHVRTGDRRGAGTDANVWLVLYDQRGNRSEPIRLQSSGTWPIRSNDHERGQTSSFELNRKATAKIDPNGDIERIELWRDSYGFADDWYVDVVHVLTRATSRLHPFPVHRWIAANRKYVIHQFDSCLPQRRNDRDRSAELHDKRKVYQYVMHVPNGPVQIKQLPEDEMFSDNYKWDIVSLKTKLLLDSALIRLRTKGRWNSFEAFKELYRMGLEAPTMCLECWRSDKWFGLQRVQGCNPLLLKLCTEIPDKLGLRKGMVEPFLEGQSMEDVLNNRKLFLVDLDILDDLKCKDNRMICSPIALFYLNKHDVLLPVAIQLFQKPGPRNPVFLPTDPSNTWLLAKMYYNNADATYHQALSHLGFTHIMMEGVVVCTHRNLSPSHPLFRLMAPHFLFLLAINTRGIDKLVSPGGWVDKTMTAGRDGLFNLIIRGYDRWRMDVHGLVPKELESRQVLEPEVLPYYPYRDDALLLFSAIRRYVSHVVGNIYTTEDKIREDWELQSWRNELARKRNKGGVGILGVPGDDREGLTTTEQLTDLVTSIISTCSLGHGSTNFQQYLQYSFPPNYPGILMGDAPRDKRPLTELDVLGHVPDKKVVVDTMVITKILSSRGTKRLGDFEVQYAFDPISTEAVQRLLEELEAISIEIKRRNHNREVPYPWLDPELVPNSISI